MYSTMNKPSKVYNADATIPIFAHKKLIINAHANSNPVVSLLVVCKLLGNTFVTNVSNKVIDNCTNLTRLLEKDELYEEVGFVPRCVFDASVR